MLLALQFLTIIPVRVGGDVSEREIAQSAAFFPLAGALQGLLAALSALVLVKVFSPEITSGLVLLVLIICNGGFDLDGLADTADALAVKSTGNPQADKVKRLAVMKDSAVGSIGAVALIMDIFLKFLFIRQLFLIHSLYTCMSVLFLMPAFSKWAPVPAMYHGAPARADGLGRIFIDNMKVNTLILSSLVLVVIYIAAAELHLIGAYGSVSVTLLVILLAIFYLFSTASVRFFRERFGGLTGDHCGALSEISEILFLAVTTIWLQHFT